MQFRSCSRISFSEEPLNHLLSMSTFCLFLHKNGKLLHVQQLTIKEEVENRNAVALVEKHELLPCFSHPLSSAVALMDMHYGF